MLEKYKEFIINAIEKGWTVKKNPLKKKSYIFSKKNNKMEKNDFDLTEFLNKNKK